MRNALVAAVIVLSLAAVSQAALDLLVDLGTGAATLRNTGATAVRFDGYSVLSASGALNPLALDENTYEYLGGWTSFEFQGLFVQVGAQKKYWAALSNTANNCSEGLLGAVKSLAAGASMDEGPLFKVGGAQDLVLKYIDSTVGTTQTVGTVTYTPEPATLSVLGLGLLGLLRRRR